MKKEENKLQNKFEIKLSEQNQVQIPDSNQNDSFTATRIKMVPGTNK